MRYLPKLAARSANPAPIEVSEAARLLWRAQELDAGLDAWTGGWISLWRDLQPVFQGPDSQMAHPEEIMERKIQ